METQLAVSRLAYLDQRLRDLSTAWNVLSLASILIMVPAEVTGFSTLFADEDPFLVAFLLVFILVFYGVPALLIRFVIVQRRNATLAAILTVLCIALTVWGWTLEDNYEGYNWADWGSTALGGVMVIVLVILWQTCTEARTLAEATSPDPAPYG